MKDTPPHVLCYEFFSFSARVCSDKLRNPVLAQSVGRALLRGNQSSLFLESVVWILAWFLVWDSESYS